MQQVFSRACQQVSLALNRGAGIVVSRQTIPKEIMLPLLRFVADGKEHSLNETVESLADQFQLTAQERAELLPSGTQEVFYNRVGWARTYLKKAGLLDSPSRGKIRITARGHDVLKSNPSKIDLNILNKFPEFIEFKHTSRSTETDKLAFEERPETPEEDLEVSYQRLRRELAQELLERTQKCSPRFFEKLVIDLLVAMGYGGSRKDAAEAVGRSGDGGIDGIIKEDKLGLDAVYVQAKRWENVVGRPIVQAFAGSLEGHRARKGVLITTSQFTQDALEYVGKIEKKIVLIGGEQLANLMIEYGIGVAEVARYEVKKIDLDYFGED